MQVLGGGIRRRFASAVLAALAAYVLVLATGPVGHHDLRCHLKSTTHCTACVQASVAGADVRGATASNPLVAAGTVLSERPERPGPTPVAEPGSRSPPVL